MTRETQEMTFEIGCKVYGPSGDIDYALVGRVREAIMPVLRRHGYEIPGVADLCALGAVRELIAEAIIVEPWVRPS